MRSQFAWVLLVSLLGLVGCRLDRRSAGNGESVAESLPAAAEALGEPDGVPTQAETMPVEVISPEVDSTSPVSVVVSVVAAEERDRDIIDRAHQAIESLDAGSFVEAADEIDGFDEAHRGYEPAELLGRFLRARLERALAASSLDAPATRDLWDANAKLAHARELVKAGRDPAARELLEEAIALDPGNTDVTETLLTVLKRLGLELYSRGDTAKATAQWRRALELRAEDEEIQRFLDRAQAVNEKL